MEDAAIQPNAEESLQPRVYWVYMLRCADDTLYTGISCNVAARVEAHNAGTGAKYTRSRRPVELVYTEECPDKSVALRREITIKHLSRSAKLHLLVGQKGD